LSNTTVNHCSESSQRPARLARPIAVASVVWRPVLYGDVARCVARLPDLRRRQPHRDASAAPSDSETETLAGADAVVTIETTYCRGSYGIPVRGRARTDEFPDQSRSYHQRL
jgi:hypothetical protein